MFLQGVNVGKCTHYKMYTFLLLHLVYNINPTGISLSVTSCYQCGDIGGLLDETCTDENVKSKHQSKDCPGLGTLTYKYCQVSD